MPDTNLHPGKLQQQQLLFAGLLAGVNGENDTKEQGLILEQIKHN